MPLPQWSRTENSPQHNILIQPQLDYILTFCFRLYDRKHIHHMETAGLLFTLHSVKSFQSERAQQLAPVSLPLFWSFCCLLIMVALTWWSTRKTVQDSWRWLGWGWGKADLLEWWKAGEMGLNEETATRWERKTWRVWGTDPLVMRTKLFLAHYPQVSPHFWGLKPKQIPFCYNTFCLLPRLSPEIVKMYRTQV